MSDFKELLIGHKAKKHVLAQNAYDFSFINIKSSKELNLSDYQGKLIIIVNTASECMFTKQYHDLQKIYTIYKMSGMVIIAVPSNNFGKQEPDSNKHIKQFCRREFAIDFPMTEKEAVIGKYMHPFYIWAKGCLGNLAAPKWNFHKYVISPEGELIDFFLPFTKITSKKVIRTIESNLPK